MESIPYELKLYSSKTKGLQFLLGGIVLMSAFFWLKQSSNFSGLTFYGSCIFAGAILLVGILQTFNRKPIVEIGKTGIIIHTLRPQILSWQRVKEFYVQKTSSSSFISIIWPKKWIFVRATHEQIPNQSGAIDSFRDNNVGIFMLPLYYKNAAIDKLCAELEQIRQHWQKAYEGPATIEIESKICWRKLKPLRWAGYSCMLLALPTSCAVTLTLDVPTESAFGGILVAMLWTPIPLMFLIECILNGVTLKDTQEYGLEIIRGFFGS